MKEKIIVASCMIVDAENRLLVVRKKNSDFFMLPGGKIQLNETPIEALRRELSEELNFSYTANNYIFLGSHTTNAANEKNTTVEGHIFLMRLDNIVDITIYAEIEEYAWIVVDNYQNFKLAHLLSEFGIPKWLNDFN